MINAELAKKLNALAIVLDAEALKWDVLPGYAVANWRRLLKLVNLQAPDIIIETEIKLMWRKIIWLRAGHVAPPGWDSNATRNHKEGMQ